ncbi:SHOCT domain-containing protein [Chloroflexota bacterium]
MMWRIWDIPLGTGWWMVFGGVWVVVLWGGLIAFIVWAIKKLTERGGRTLKQCPLNVAKERYTRGEISNEKFNRIKKELS